MKVLYIVRHAKSDWDNPVLSDFERPLNVRGRRDAPVMAGIVQEQKEPPTLIVSSSALRAVTTARIFSEELGLPLDSMMITNALYEAGTEDSLGVIHAIDDGVQIAMIVGHNPSQTTLVNFLSDASIDELPTCACVKIEFANAVHWRDVARHTGKLVMFERPTRGTRD